MIYAIWTPDRTVDVAKRVHRPVKVRAKSLRDAAVNHAAKLGVGTHELMVACCPLTFPCAVHGLTRGRRIRDTSDWIGSADDDSGTGGPFSEGLADQAMKARAALAKAEGGTK